MQGLQRGMIPPGPNSLKQYDVNLAGAVEVIWQPLYDFQDYAAAGQTSLTFFALPQGQAGKTLDDTNMEAAGQLPAPKNMLVTGIEIDFYPGVNPGTFGAQAANTFWNDMYTFYKSGHLELFIGSKTYNIGAPLGRYPVGHRLTGTAALSDTTTAAADAQGQIGYASTAGRTYQITPIKIPSNQNFSVTAKWATAVALPSSTAARIGVNLLGFQYRLSQ